MLKKIAFAGVGVLLLASPLIASAQSACPSLSYGSSGPAVFALQNILFDSYGNFPAPTGNFRSITEAAVKQWQCEHGIVCSGSPATTGWGVVGPRTARAMGLCDATSTTSQNSGQFSQTSFEATSGGAQNATAGAGQTTSQNIGSSQATNSANTGTSGTAANTTVGAFVNRYVADSGSCVFGTNNASGASLEADIERLSPLIQSRPAGGAARASGSSVAGSVSAQSAATQADAQLQAAQERGQKMQQLAKISAKAFLRNTVSTKVRSELPSAVRAQIESKVVVTGKMEVLHIDDFSNTHNSRFDYHVRAGGKRLAFYPAGKAPALSSGSTVRINGYQLGQTLVANGSGDGIAVITEAEPESVGVQKTLVIPVTTGGASSLPSSQEMKNTIFSGGFEKYFEEQSYGKVSFTGDVTDWVVVPTMFDCYGSGGLTSLDDQPVKAHLLQRGIDLSQYGRVVFVGNGAGGGCSIIGKMDGTFNGGSYRYSLSWIGWPNSGYHMDGSEMSGFDSVLAHELGHGLGVAHANSWECSGPSLDNNCRHQEYGNNFDIMGTGFYGGHFNAFYKELLGWLTPSSEVQITQSGNYSLAPLENTSGVRAGIITNPATPSADPLYLEYRQPLGFDSLLPLASAGIHLNQVIAMPSQLPFTRLIYANLGNTTNTAQPALMPGGSFSWGSHGISIGSLTTTPSSAAFSVNLTAPPCIRVGLTPMNEENRLRVSPGSTGYLQFLLQNDDTVACAASTVSITSSISNSLGWHISQYPSEPFMLYPGESTYVTVVFGVPFDVTLGDHTLSVSITDTTNGRVSTVERAITMVAPPNIQSVEPASGSAGSAVMLRGSGFATMPDSNLVVMQSSDMYANVSNINASPDGKSLSFIFPTSMFNIYAEASAATPPGTYSVTVQRSNGATSNTVSFEVTSSTGVPSEPSGRTASCSTDGTHATLSWNPVSGATLYPVRVDDPALTCTGPLMNSPGNGGCVSPTEYVNDSLTSASTSVTLNITPFTTYGWWVHAYNANGWSTPTKQSFSCFGLPIAVDLKVNDSDGPVTIALGDSVVWSWTSRNVSSCVLSWTGPTSGSLNEPTTGSLTTSPNPVGAYVMTMTCRTPSGSNVSDSVNLTVTDTPTIPRQPRMQAVACSTDGTQATLSWETSAGATSYPVRYSGSGLTCPTSGGWWSASAGECDLDSFTGTSVTVPVTPGVTYRWWVHGVNANGWSPGTPVSFSCPSNPLPPPPTGLTASCNGGTSATLTWTRGAGSVYSFPRIAGSPQTSQSTCPPGYSWASPTSCYQDNITTSSITYPVQAGTTYQWWVHNSAALPNATWSNVSAQTYGTDFTCSAGAVQSAGTVTTGTVTTVPPAPSGLTAACNGGTSVTLTWTRGTGAAASYPRIAGTGQSSCPSGWSWASPTSCFQDGISATSVTFPVTEGRTYSWWVHDSAQPTGDWSQISPQTYGTDFTCSSPVVSNVPTGLTAVCTDSTHAVLSWNPVSGAGQYPVRVDDPNTSTCDESTVSGPNAWCPAPTDYANETGVSPLTITVQSGIAYRWWIHTLTNGAWSDAAIGYFTCDRTAPANTANSRTLSQLASALNAIIAILNSLK